MSKSRSIIFYAWAWLAVQSVLAAAVVTFVLAGTAYQRSAIADLHGSVQRAEIANLTMLAGFLDAQRAARGYQATGQAGLLAAYRAGRSRFEAALGDLHRLARRDPLAGLRAQDVRAEEQTARSAFLADDRAIAAPAGSGEAAALYQRASVLAGVFTGQAGRLGRRLDASGNALAARSERVLGVGLGWTAAVLVLGVMLPVIAVALGLRWVSRPLHTVTTALRARALGDSTVRAIPGGPADARDLAASFNFLADESDRVRAAEAERARLLAQIRQAAIRIRRHLRGEAILREAVTAIHDNLTVDFVWLGLVSGERLTIADGDPGAWGEIADIVGYFPPGSVGWMREIYRHRSSYLVQDLGAVQAEEIPVEIRQALLHQGATSLLLTPFGAGQELLGCLTLLRSDPGNAWAPVEIEAVESLAGDIGRGLEHARLYEAEERLVAELKSLDQAKASFLASASHDLRTPLTSILGYVELLSDAEDGMVRPEQAKMLDAIDRNARRLRTMTEDMLTISKIELGAFTSRLQPLDLTSLIPAAADAIRPSAVAAGLKFEVSDPGHGLMVDGDAEQLDRVLLNLLSNAVKYTPSGGTVTLSAAREGDSAVLTVSDTGIGIPEPDQASLFNRFFRAANAVELAIPGSGLGLSIVRTIVRNHHAEITVASAKDLGTTVTVRFPLLAQSAGAGPAAGRPAVSP